MLYGNVCNESDGPNLALRPLPRVISTADAMVRMCGFKQPPRDLLIRNLWDRISLVSPGIGAATTL